MTFTHPEDMHQRLAVLMELIRGLLNLSRMADHTRTAKEHHRAVITALPCITGNVDVLFQGDLIDVVFQQEGINAN